MRYRRIDETLTSLYSENTFLNNQIRTFVHNRLCKWTKMSVLGGPFKGLKYIKTPINSALFPKILGTYEQELYGVWEEIVQLKEFPFEQIINIGAGEGYYTVGPIFRKWCKGAIAYETDPRAEKLISELCHLNAVSPSRISVRGKCDGGLLRGDCKSSNSVLIIMDVEGDEELLLSEMMAEDLRHSYILVEVHEEIQPGIEGRIRRRFRNSHSVRTILSEPRPIQDAYVWDDWVARLIPSYWLGFTLTEFRPWKMSWLWLRPLRGLS